MKLTTKAIEKTNVVFFSRLKRFRLKQSLTSAMNISSKPTHNINKIFSKICATAKRGYSIVSHFYFSCATRFTFFLLFLFFLFCFFLFQLRSKFPSFKYNIINISSAFVGSCKSNNIHNVKCETISAEKKERRKERGN